MMVRWSSAIFVTILSFYLIFVLIRTYSIPSTDEELLRKNSELKRNILEKWFECARKQLDKIHTAEETLFRYLPIQARYSNIGNCRACGRVDGLRGRLSRLELNLEKSDQQIKYAEFYDEQFFWLNFAPLTTYCDVTEKIDQLGLIPLKNDDEVKYALMPTGNTNSTISFITLGIGKDITAEKAFKNESNYLGHQVNFYGADPITEENSELYSKIGDYFPFAIGGKTEISSASVFKNGSYVPEEVNHVELLHFLKQELKINEIDHLWLDAEGAEFGLFDYFYNDGPLERNGIHFCQMNLEVHIGDVNRKIEFMKFAKRLAMEKRFVMLKSVYISHIRLFLFNFGDSKCVDKYL